MSFYVSSSTGPIMTSSAFPMLSNSSFKNQTIFQSRKSLPNSDSLHAFKREEHDENVHSDLTKKPKRTGKYYRKREHRVVTPQGVHNPLMSFSAGTSQPQPFQGFLTHRPSMTGFDSLSSVSCLPFSPTPNQAMLVTANELEQADTRSDNGDMAFALTLGPSPLSSLPDCRTESAIANHSISGFRRHSFPITQPHPTSPSQPIVHPTSGAPSPALQLPPIPQMPSQDVDVSVRQQILDDTIKTYKELLEKWQQETHQHTKAILLDDIVERNKFISNLTNDIKRRLKPRTFTWPETQYPFCIDITEDDDDFP